MRKRSHTAIQAKARSHVAVKLTMVTEFGPDSPWVVLVRKWSKLHVEFPNRPKSPKNEFVSEPVLTMRNPVWRISLTCQTPKQFFLQLIFAPLATYPDY